MKLVDVKEYDLNTWKLVTYPSSPKVANTFIPISFKKFLKNGGFLIIPAELGCINFLPYPNLTKGCHILKSKKEDTFSDVYF